MGKHRDIKLDERKGILLEIAIMVAQRVSEETPQMHRPVHRRLRSGNFTSSRFRPNDFRFGVSLTSWPEVVQLEGAFRSDDKCVMFTGLVSPLRTEGQEKAKVKGVAKIDAHGEIILIDFELDGSSRSPVSAVPVSTPASA